MSQPDDDSRGAGRAGGCRECGAALAKDQRYCLHCAARRGALPPAVAMSLASMLRRGGAEKAPPSGEQTDPPTDSDYMPSPRIAAVLVMSMLGLGVLLGSTTSQLAQSAGFSSILLEVAPSSKPVVASLVEASAPAPAPVAASAPAPVPATASASSVPFAPSPIEEPAAEAVPEAPKAPPPLPEPAGLPPVKHVFLVVLGENGYEETFGKTPAAPYLGKTLKEKGEVLANYYAVTKGDLANQIALISGQGPTVETAANCPNYTDIAPGTVNVEGQVEGSGCIYPAPTQTLADQLASKGLKWRAYVEDIGNGPAQPTSCRHPALGATDPSQAPMPGDAYETWRNPFVYFHSLIDGSECAANDVGLEQLGSDLKKATTTPTLSYIVPNACHDGGEVPCEAGQPAGPLVAEATLQTVVPEIEASPAYKEGGLIAITSAQAPQAGPKIDTSACCISPTYPNLPPAPATEAAAGPIKPIGGGGRVGLLLISPFVAPGTVNESSYYNHYSLLASIEELFGLEPLGYAAEIALSHFEESVYTGEAAASSSVAPKRATGRGSAATVKRSGPGRSRPAR